MRATMTRRYRFAAAHRLSGLREGHKCMDPHGHNYVLEVTLTAPGGIVNGLIMDAGDLDVCVQPILSRLDHKSLNDIVDERPSAMRMKAQPSVENIALYLWDALAFLSNDGRARVERVRVHETDRLWADVTRE